MSPPAAVSPEAAFVRRFKALREYEGFNNDDLTEAVVHTEL